MYNSVYKHTISLVLSLNLHYLCGMDKKKPISHPAADALDWKEAITLVNRLSHDERYRDAMLVASGCYLGLRISELLTLRWSDILDNEVVTVYQKKTHKKRKLKINAKYQEFARKCYRRLSPDSREDYIFTGIQNGGKVPITRGRASQLLKDMKARYDIRSAGVFSTHSLRKTFGRRVWLVECEKGRGENALVLLCDVFGHSSVNITKRYLGIRESEILSVYDSL